MQGTIPSGARPPHGLLAGGGGMVSNTSVEPESPKALGPFSLEDEDGAGAAERGENQGTGHERRRGSSGPIEAASSRPGRRRPDQRAHAAAPTAPPGHCAGDHRRLPVVPLPVGEPVRRTAPPERLGHFPSGRAARPVAGADDAYAPEQRKVPAHAGPPRAHRGGPRGRSWPRRSG